MAAAIITNAAQCQVGYFSMEIALDPAYSGGLGIRAGLVTGFSPRKPFDKRGQLCFIEVPLTPVFATGQFETHPSRGANFLQKTASLFQQDAGPIRGTQSGFEPAAWA